MQKYVEYDRSYADMTYYFKIPQNPSRESVRIPKTIEIVCQKKARMHTKASLTSIALQKVTELMETCINQA